MLPHQSFDHSLFKAVVVPVLGGGGVLPEKLGGGMWPTSQKPLRYL